MQTSIILYILCSNYSADSITWSPTLKPVQLEPFSQSTGQCIAIPTIIKDILVLFFTSPIVNHISQHSNKYGSERVGEKFSTWQKMTMEELLAYIGIMVLMGIVRLPSIRDYWSKSGIYHYMPVASRITRNRLNKLHRYFHFADNSTLLPPTGP